MTAIKLPTRLCSVASHLKWIGRSGSILLIASCLALGGCKALRHHDDKVASPESLYDKANKELKDGSYGQAIKSLEALTARFPFSDPARQSRIDLIYAYYKMHEKESAVDAADSFIRENPTHPRIDYAYYIKGLVYFERQPNFMEKFFNVDISKRPPQDLRKSFEAFSRVVTQYPQSAYAADAHQRMVYVRNRLGDYEIHVANYYMERGAYVAAVDRARYVLENYDGSPATRDALEIMAQAYTKLELPELAADTQKILTTNYPDPRTRKTKKHWWHVF